MLNPKTVAHSVANKISTELNLPLNDGLTVAYGLEIIFGSVLKFFCLFILAVLFDIVAELAVLFSVMAPFRVISGGVHCSSYYRCLVFGTAMMLAASLSAKYAGAPLPTELLLLLVALIGLFGVLTIHRRVPLVPPNLPVKTPEQRTIYKRYSFAFVVFWSILFAGLILLEVEKGLIVAGTLGVVMQLLNLTETGEALVNDIDRFLKKFIP